MRNEDLHLYSRDNGTKISMRMGCIHRKAELGLGDPRRLSYTVSG